MQRRRPTELPVFWAILTASVLAFASGLARASQETRELAGPVPCAVLENYSGAVQIMDSTRSRIIETTEKASIPCGGWVSVGAGWAGFAHRDGFRIQLAANTFVQLPDGKTESKATGDSVVLYKGQLYGKAMNGAIPLNVITANSRARIREASAVVIYDASEEESQLIALSGTPSLENRFQGARKIAVHAGEASGLDFRLMRVVPSLPRALSYASLKPKLVELHVPDRDMAYALRKTAERSDRKFASEESVREGAHRKADIWDNGEKGDSARKPANLEFAKGEAARRYRKSEAAEKEAKLLQVHLTQRLSGGQDVGDQILFPRKNAAGRGPVSIQVEDPAEKLNQAERRSEDREKKRLIEELSQIRAD